NEAQDPKLKSILVIKASEWSPRSKSKVHLGHQSERMKLKIQNLDPSWSSKRANEAQDPKLKSILVIKASEWSPRSKSKVHLGHQSERMKPKIQYKNPTWLFPKSKH
ncbi:hypothetical protein, partial [Heyndrickxia sporothermodurans]|uniref:hypothetical protein n=1 Tax=Heyndrickxia sporothermodurans TaxID=46224 RepID=UPI000D4E847A